MTAMLLRFDSQQRPPLSIPQPCSSCNGTVRVVRTFMLLQYNQGKIQKPVRCAVRDTTLQAFPMMQAQGTNGCGAIAVARQANIRDSNATQITSHCQKMTGGTLAVVPHHDNDVGHDDGTSLRERWMLDNLTPSLRRLRLEWGNHNGGCDCAQAKARPCRC